MVGYEKLRLSASLLAGEEVGFSVVKRLPDNISPDNFSPGKVVHMFGHLFSKYFCFLTSFPYFKTDENLWTSFLLFIKFFDNFSRLFHSVIPLNFLTTFPDFLILVYLEK